MSEYFDSKGIRHLSESDRDAANRRYLSDEQDAREETAGLLRKQALIQAEQLRVSEQREWQERAHNERVEALMRQHYDEEQKQREFTRDIQWLERSDAKGRFEFFLEKAHRSIIAHLSSFLFRTSALAESPLAPRRIGDLKTKLTDLHNANRAYADAVAQVDRIKEELRVGKIDSQKNGNVVSLAAVICSVFILLTAGWVWAIIDELIKSQSDGKVIVGSAVGALLLVGAAFAFFVRYKRALKKSKEARAVIADLNPLLAPTKEKLPGLLKKRSLKLEAAQLAYRHWYADNMAILENTLESTIQNGAIGVEIRSCISRHQTEYPSKLNIDWTAIDREFLDSQGRNLTAETLAEVAETNITSRLLRQQLKASDQEEIGAGLTMETSLIMEAAGELNDSPGTDHYCCVWLTQLTVSDAERRRALVEVLCDLEAGLGSAEAEKLVDNIPSLVLDEVTPQKARDAKEKLFSMGAFVDVCLPGKHLYEVWLDFVPDEAETALINAVRELNPGLPWAKAKELGETCGIVIENTSLAEAREVKKKLETLGAEVHVGIEGDAFCFVELLSVPTDRRFAVIKTLCGVKGGLELAEANKLVETTPVIVLADVSLREAQRAKQRLSLAGAKVHVYGGESEAWSPEDSGGEAGGAASDTPPLPLRSSGSNHPLISPLPQIKSKVSAPKKTRHAAWLGISIIIAALVFVLVKKIGKVSESRLKIDDAARNSDAISEKIVFENNGGASSPASVGFAPPEEVQLIGRKHDSDPRSNALEHVSKTELSLTGKETEKNESAINRLPKPTPILIRSKGEGTYPDPGYPSLALRRHYEGKVILDVAVGPDGSPISVEVKESSGYAILDDYSSDWVKTRWRWPKGETCHYQVPFIYQIK